MHCRIVFVKKEFSVLELACVVKEMQTLVGARINKVLQYSNRWLAFECFKTNVGRVFINICRPGLIWFGQQKSESGDFGFHKNLSKQIDGAKIVSISQIGSERIVKISLLTPQKKVDVFVELFNKGEVALCDLTGKILCLWETQIWKNRVLKTGESYSLPKKLINIFEMQEEEFALLLKTIVETVSKTLATELSIGGVYANELCLISGIDKNKAVLTQEELRVLYANLHYFFERKIDASVVYEKESKNVKDIVPYLLKNYESFKQVHFAFYCAAIDEVLSSINASDQSSNALSQFELKKKKLLNIIEVQKLHLSAINKAVIEEQRKGELIYENYSKFKEILEKISAAREKMSFIEIKSKAKEFGIKDFDDKTGEITVEV